MGFEKEEKTNRLPKSKDDGRLVPVLDGCLKENGGRCCAGRVERTLCISKQFPRPG